MTINYNFDKDEAFDYDVNLTNYFYYKCTPEELMKIAKDYWDEGMPDDKKKEYIEEYGISTIDESTSTDDVIAEILADANEEWFEEHLYDEIKDAYEDDAREAYDDMKAYRNDPYGYNGVNPSDFF